MNRYFPRPDLCLTCASKPRIHVTRHTLPGAPDALHGRKALFASDFHLNPKLDPRNMIDLMASCGADMILLGGDYADRKEDTLRLFDAFRELRAPMGIYAVRGNNDAEAFRAEKELREAMHKSGIRLLVNESVSPDGFDGVLRIGGAEESKYHKPDYARIFPEDTGFRILLSHYPVLPDAPCTRMPELMLSGHTHGGQFNFLGFTPYAIGFERLSGKGRLAPCAVSGLHRFGPTAALVSKGIGMSRIPLRVGVKSEIHLISFGEDFLSSEC